MRTKNSFFNMAGVLTLYFIKVLFAFAGKTFLIKILGDEYNGINALFGSIISMLSVAELGIGAAIVYNLYKPVKESNIEQIKSLMRFYRDCYFAISGIVLLLGICMIPFLNGLVGQIHISESIYTLFFLFLIESASSYLLTYKRSIFYADQKNYIISICDIGYTFALHSLQIAALFLTKNYVSYLVAGIICRVSENLIIQYCANRMYPYLKERDVKKISVTVRQDIAKKVKGLLFHKIGSYVVFGTDNLIMSRMIGIVAEGLYSNYLTIINPLANIVGQMINALQGSVGNLLVETDKEKNYTIYKRIALLNFWLYTVVSICFFYLIQDFIVLWLGERYLFNGLVVFVLSLNLWQTGMRNALGVFKNAAGIFYEDRYIPIIESIINLVVSIILTRYCGIVGVFLGTFVSSLAIFCYSYPVMVYQPLFNKGYGQYIKEMIGFAAQWAIYVLCSHFVSEFVDNFNIPSPEWQFLLKAVILFVAVNLLLLIGNGKSREFRYYKDLVVTRFLRR